MGINYTTVTEIAGSNVTQEQITRLYTRYKFASEFCKNKDRAGFNPSPYSNKYFSANELFELLSQNRFKDVALYGDCPVTANTVNNKIIQAIKRTAVTFHLIPSTMKGKEFLKRIFMGKLIPLPPEIQDGIAEYTPPEHIPYDFPNHDYKVMYALGFK
jgi:hypothetical protein